MNATLAAPSKQTKTMTRPAYSLIIPTYRRQDVLQTCLERVAALDYPLESIEVRVYDNGSPSDSRAVAESFLGRIPNLTYTLNEPGHGLGYSLCRGAKECSGERIVEMNDDALVDADFLNRLDDVFETDSSIGVVGVRAIEDEYVNLPGGIGEIDAKTGDVVGNFNRPTDSLINVDHVYGFCYAYTRSVVNRGGQHDHTLLAQDFSSGNRIETDQCLTAKRLGFRVVYDGRLTVRHLAKPRADMSERSLKWKLNHTRNTLYLFLKHYGLFGKRGLALRYTFLMDVGIVSAVKKPTKANVAYFLMGLRARASAFGNWIKYKMMG